MAEQQPAIKRRGNPNFGKAKKTETEIIEDEITKDLNRQYIFQLLQTHERAKPRDGKTGELVGSAYQPFWGAVNSGMAWDPNYTPKGATKPGAQRRWRYLHTYPTIWVDEQIDPEPTKEDLADPNNDIIFRQGVLRIFGHQKTKLQALMLNNGFKDCVRPLKNVVKDFELLDQDKIDKEVLQTLDDAFEAEKAAREATNDEMYATAYFFGIDLDKSDEAIRKEFINKARSNPKVFNREFVNPKNRFKYTFLEALADNLISGTKNPGRLTYVETGAIMFDLKTEDTAEELANMCMSNHEKSMNLYNKLEKMYKDEK